MTDNEIMKALECCRDDERYDTCEYCLKCPVSNYNLDEETEAVNCVDALLTRAIDLIKRKDAEIEQWKEEANKYQNNWCESVKEIDRLKKDRYIFKDGVLELIPRTDIEEIKSEVIKEFAERLTDRICENVNRSMDNPDGDNYYPIDVYKDIDNLVKEMTE